MSLPARPRSHSYLWHCVFEGESQAPSVCLCVNIISMCMCGDVVIVSCLCLVCVSQTPSHTCPQKMTPWRFFFSSQSFRSVWVSMCVSLLYRVKYEAVFSFLFQVYDFRGTDRCLTGWHFSLATWVHSWCDLDVGGEAATVRRTNQIDLFIEWKQQNSPWWFSCFSFTVRLPFL